MANSTAPLGRLRRIDLREAWKHEAVHFTRWLAEEENLALLGDELGLDLRLLQTEAAVGSFSVDILAEEENTGRKIIIENQLGETDHDHLGKLLTYASGYDAQVIVWVVKDARDEHRQAIDWLNERTDENTEFFLVRIELWQIGESPFAPKFDLVSKPNDWTRAVRHATEPAELTDTKAQQREFWTELQAYAKGKGSRLRFQKPSPQHWTNLAVGSSAAHISLTVNSREGMVGAELYIPDDKALFQRLADQKVAIEAELGEPAVWMELPGKKASRIRLSGPGAFDDRSKWVGSFEWLLSRASRLAEVFPKYL